MSQRLKTIEQMQFEAIHLLNQVRDTYASLGNLRIKVHPFATGSNDIERIVTGSQLKRAATNPSQGLWLAKLAAYVGKQAGKRINIMELGTSVGISGMYLLAGMGQSYGGRLITFEGHAELAKVADRHMNKFITQNNLNVEFEIVVGLFDDTFKPYATTSSDKLDLAFIDGNHQETATIEYHELVRQMMTSKGIIVHDDIAWSSSMIRAWRHIQAIEGEGKTSELHLGGRPSRGVVFLGAEHNDFVEILNQDGKMERLARRVVRVVRGLRKSVSKIG